MLCRRARYQCFRNRAKKLSAQTPNLHEFWGHRDKLPYDQHWFLALAAPRPFIALEGITDTISLPEAVRQSILGAQPAYALYGVESRLGVNYAQHGHAFTAEDWTALMDFFDKHLRGRMVDRKFDRFPTEEELDAAAARSVPAASGSNSGRIRIILVGDSTVAPRNGWGPGFCALTSPLVTCLNLAKNGRSTSSYRAEGSWGEVMQKLKSHSGFDTTYVLVQFGHNDQPGKPGRSTDLSTEFPANMREYVRDIRAAGAKPVLVTPLTRRIFKDGKVDNTLAPWAEAVRRVSAEEGIPWLDLNFDSAAAVQKMGPTEANTLAMAPPLAAVAQDEATRNSPPLAKPPARAGQVSNAEKPADHQATLFDYTHLGDKGSAFFGRMVAEELIGAIPELRPYIKR